MAHLMKDQAIPCSYSDPLFNHEPNDDRTPNEHFGSVTPSKNANHLGKRYWLFFILFVQIACLWTKTQKKNEERKCCASRKLKTWRWPSSMRPSSWNYWLIFNVQQMPQHTQCDSEPWEDEWENKRNNVYKDWVITFFFK